MEHNRTETQPIGTRVPLVASSHPVTNPAKFDLYELALHYDGGSTVRFSALPTRLAHSLFSQPPPLRPSLPSSLPPENTH